MSKFFKNKSKKVDLKPQEPRQIADIQKEYQELSAQAANAQYLVFVKTKELEQVNERMLQVNQEASIRIELDKANQLKEESREVANV
jgi:hypothetical protein